MSDFLSDWNFRGLTYQLSDEAVMARLAKGSLTVYNGFDPSGDSLHVGHLVPLLALRRLQMAGNRPIVLAGGATGMIGDPSFKSDERVLLTAEQVAMNVEAIRPQLERFVDFSAGKSQAKVVNNYDWTIEWGVLDFLREIGKHFTINQMIARESVKERLDNREQGISYTEFSYSVLQALDFLYLFEHENCEAQMGASDQWGNILSGVELIRKKLGKTAFGITLPLLLKNDGTKFGKTESGTTAWLNAEKTSPFALYQFFIRSEDADIAVMLRRLTMLSKDEIEELESRTINNPGERVAQKTLAKHVVELVHGVEDATYAMQASDLLYSEAVVEADEKTLEVIANSGAPQISLSFGGPISLTEAMIELGLSSSASDFARSVAQGGVYLNNQRVEAKDCEIQDSDLLHKKFVLVRKGKRDYGIIKIER